jgi:hypothetical protein
VTKYADSIEDGRFTTKGLNRTLFFSEIVMNKFIKNNSKTTALPPPFHPQLESFLENKKIVDVSLVDNKLNTQKDLVECFIKEVDSTTVFNYIYSDDISYQKWINTYSAHKQAVDELRANKQTVLLEYDRNNFRYINEDEYNEEQLLLIETFPFHVIENFESNSAKLNCS